VHEVTPSPKYTAYNAAKGGLLSFTRGLALELAPRNTTVNAIAPGLTRAPPTLERIESPEGQEKIKKNIPLQRAGEPREVGRWRSIWPLRRRLRHRPELHDRRRPGDQLGPGA
jgi:glucose 1-dehydrogenase